jgi:hypothetical protein
MLEVKTVIAAQRYAPCRDEGGEWFVVDQERDDRTVLHCADADGAAMIAALMNGDIAALADVSEETLARCRELLVDALRLLKPRGRPSVGAGDFPLL